MSTATERLSKVYSWKAKKTAMTGSAYARNLRSPQLEPYRRSVQHVLKVLRHTDDETALMVKQFESFLFSLPIPPRQNSTRGLPPKQRAQHILKHIWLQQSRYRTRPADEGAALRILVRAMSASLCPKETSAPQYQRTQISRAVYNLLRSDALCANISGTRCLSSIRVAGGEEHPS